MKLGHSDMHGLGNSAGNNAITAAESTGKPPPASIIYQLHALIRQKKPTSHYVCLQLMYVACSRPANEHCYQLLTEHSFSEYTCYLTAIIQQPTCVKLYE